MLFESVLHKPWRKNDGQSTRSPISVQLFKDCKSKYNLIIKKKYRKIWKYRKKVIIIYYFDKLNSIFENSYYFGTIAASFDHSILNKLAKLDNHLRL